MRCRLRPPYLRARHELDVSALDAALLEWTVGLVGAELDGEAAEYVGPEGVGWLELDRFRVLARVTLDPSGHLDRLELMDVIERQPQR